MGLEANQQFDRFVMCDFALLAEHSNNQLLDGMVGRSGVLRTDPPLLPGRIRLHPADGQAAPPQLYARLPSG